MIGESVYRGGSIILLIVVTLAALSIILRTVQNGIPPMPSSAPVRARMIALLRELRPQGCGTAIELGSGWGMLSIDVSRAIPAATVIGYENSPVPHWFSMAARRISRRENLRLERANIHSVSLREADVVLCYLSPRAMSLLRPKLEAELKPGSLVISNTFAVPAWRPTRVAVMEDMYRTRIYVYVAGGSHDSSSGRLVDILE
jgi:precorrin-6B methylase 2